MKVERKCKIVSKDWLNRDAVYMVLEVGDMVRTSWKGPGQFVHIKCGDSLLLRRPISVCTCQEDQPEDLLAIVGGSFGPDGGASYVEIATVKSIRRRNEEITARHNA